MLEQNGYFFEKGYYIENNSNKFFLPSFMISMGTRMDLEKELIKAGRAN